MKRNPAIMGTNHKSIKLRNRSLVLKLICTGTNMTRIDLSRKTGLSKMSITNIVDGLIKEGYIIELTHPAGIPGTAVQEGRALFPQGEGTGVSLGRRPVCLGPSDLYLILGIYISRDFATATLSNLKCEALYEERCCFSFGETEETFVSKIKELARNALASDTARDKKITGIGVACIGPLDIKGGIILEPPNFHKVRFVPLRDILMKEFGCEVVMKNDMNASAVAEKLYGWGKNISNFIYLGVTNGIGSGIITNNTLFEGDMGFSGEIGHMSIHFEGPRCACGNNGCLELYASIPEIVSQARNSLSLGVESELGREGEADWPEIVRCAARGDRLALNLLDKMCLYISIGLVSLINLFDPSVIFLGHEIALAGGLVTQRLGEFVRNRTFSHEHKSVPIEISAFGHRAPIVGSAAIFADRLFNGY